ncbi:MAG TPA: cell division ATPase MinD [archaeon]|nr:cell division ATPase MinD [archaeon]
MTRVIAVVSGKGGTGKTTVTANVGVFLANLGKKVLLIDADVAMANLTLLMDLSGSPITLHDVLAGDAKAHDALYDYGKNLWVMPSGLAFETYTRVDMNKLKKVIDLVRAEFDYILLDCPAGVDKAVIAGIAACDEVILVVNPNAASIADALKAKIVSERLGVEPIGCVLNLVQKLQGEVPQDEIVKMLEVPVFAVVPDDSIFRKGFLMSKPKPAALLNNDSLGVQAMKMVAARIAGVPVEAVKVERQGFIAALMQRLFGKKK